MRRIIGPAFVGVLGTAILIGLCVWQVQRLAWKEDLLAQLEARLSAPPVDIPASPNPARHQFLQVETTGQLGPDELHVLTTRKPSGPGFRVIAPLTRSDGRRVLVDLGYVPEAEKAAERFDRRAEGTVLGALFWPEERDGFTPDPDLGANIWFARDVAEMAEVLGTEPVLVVAEAHPLGTTPLPERLGVNLPNNHLNYAITWGLLAVVWAVMTAVWLRSRQVAAAA